MELKDNEIRKLSSGELIDSLCTEEFDANANEYYLFEKRIREAAGKEQIMLKYTDECGMMKGVALGELYALVFAEAEMHYSEITSIDELKDYPAAVKDIIREHFIDKITEADEFTEERALYNYEIIVPSDAEAILAQLECAENYAFFVKNRELARLQDEIRKVVGNSADL